MSLCLQIVGVDKKFERGNQQFEFVFYLILNTQV